MVQWTISSNERPKRKRRAAPFTEPNPPIKRGRKAPFLLADRVGFGAVRDADEQVRWTCESDERPERQRRAGNPTTQCHRKIWRTGWDCEKQPLGCFSSSRRSDRSLRSRPKSAAADFVEMAPFTKPNPPIKKGRKAPFLLADRVPAESRSTVVRHGP